MSDPTPDLQALLVYEAGREEEKCDLQAQEAEEWGVCAGCSTYERAGKLNSDGLCFWCTPEGKAEAERFQAKIAAAMVRAGAVPVRVGTAEAFDVKEGEG